MAKYYRSEDDAAPIVESPVTEDEGQVIAATATTEPDLPPAGPTEPIADVESTREPEADPTVPEQRFRQEGEEVEAAPAPAEAPAETPAAPAPMDAPAEIPAADADPAEAPVAPAPEGMPAAPVDAPVADVPAAAPMVPPQPEAEVAPVAPAEGEVAPAAPVAPEVEAPTAPVDQPVEDAPVQCGGKRGFKQQDGEGEEISVVETPEPTMPAETESETCPETGNEYVTKDVNEPINPVISQTDELATDDDANDEGDEAGGTEPAETGKTDDITIIEPDASEQQDEAEAEIDEATMSFRQAFRMEGEAEVEAGDQDVNATVNVNVRKDDGDEHADDTAETGTEVSDNGDQNPAQFFRQEGDEAAAPEIVETVADVNKVETGDSAEDKAVDNAVPDPIDPNAGNPDPEQCFQSFMQEGGQWM